MCLLYLSLMASLTLIKFGNRSIRIEQEPVNEQDTKAVYRTTGFAYVEAYNDVEYVTKLSRSVNPVAH